MNKALLKIIKPETMLFKKKIENTYIRNIKISK